MKVTILQGISGSGKSYYAKGLTGEHVSADTFFTDAKGEYYYDRSKQGDAHRWCLRRFIDFIRMKVDLVVDNTSCRAIELAPYVAIAQAYEAELCIVRVECDLQLAIVRSGRGPHRVPEEIVRQQWKNMLEYKHPSFWPSMQHVSGMEEDK